MSEVTNTATMKCEGGSFLSQHGTWKKASILLSVIMVVVWYFWGGAASNSSNQHASMAGGVPEVAVSAELETPNVVSDEEQRKLIVGKWEIDRSGRRELIVNEDGTARMDVTIENTLARMLLGEHIVLVLEWTIENEVLTLTTTGGEPASKVNLMTSMYGKERKQKIITLDETTLHHPDDDPEGEDHIWKRITN